MDSPIVELTFYPFSVVVVLAMIDQDPAGETKNDPSCIFNKLRFSPGRRAFEQALCPRSSLNPSEGSGKLRSICRIVLRRAHRQLCLLNKS
jgi:hypothetical protein